MCEGADRFLKAHFENVRHAHWSRFQAIPRSCFLFQTMAGFEPLNFDL